MRKGAAWLLLCSLCLATAGAANPSPLPSDVALCVDSDAGDAARIAACTRLIEGSGATGLELARYYAGRAEARAIAATPTKADLGPALSDFRRMAQLDPDHALSGGNLSTGDWNTFRYMLMVAGEWKRDAGDLHGAMADFEELVVLDPTFAPGYNGRGLTHLKLGQEQAALEDFEQALRVTPDYKAAMDNRAFVLQARAERQRQAAAAQARQDDSINALADTMREIEAFNARQAQHEADRARRLEQNDAIYRAIGNGINAYLGAKTQGGTTPIPSGSGADQSGRIQKPCTCLDTPGVCYYDSAGNYAGCKGTRGGVGI